MRSTRKSWSAWFAVACLMAAGSLTVAVPAQADTFTPQAGPPSTGPLNYPAVLQPATPRSTATYAVMTTVGSSAGISNLDQVTMCWYKGGASSTCADAATDPKTQFQMTWTQATDTFAVTGTNHYLNAASTSGYGSGAGLTMDMVFTFRVSDAMLAGSDWNVTVTTVDDQGQQSSRSTDPAVTVNYFGAVTTQRASQDYGTLLQGSPFPFQDAVLRENVSDGAFVANGPSGVTFAATDFTGPGNPLAMAFGFPGAPAHFPVMPGEVGLDCNAGAEFFEPSAVRVANEPWTMQLDLFAGGTGETPDATLRNSCRLKYGGGATVANQPYSNTVTVGVGATP